MEGRKADAERTLRKYSYGENEKAFFAANDTDGDGVLDVIDLFNISNMRYGN